MPRRIQIAPHLSLAALAQPYRQANLETERSHYQIITRSSGSQRKGTH
ncbi:MAG: hypothetical protein NZ772_06350 [Cyanobacteria bacterium]|nr:hypothetical protein [Cyanobacteriota bacterium]MDW8200733.1 hypothetical protein [Cyanobacteriota bacterium SKYGB_h_bin112]